MILDVQGLKVYYEVIGEGEPVVLLHGWGTDSSNMRPILNLLRETGGFRVYALDFPGFGFSQRPPAPWDVGCYTSFLLSFMNSFQIHSADFVCHSFGGRVAIKLAASHPDRVKRLVLIASAGIRPERSSRQHFKVSLVKFARWVQKNLPVASVKKLIGRYIENQGSADYRAAGEMRQTFVKVVNEDLRGCLPAVQASTLLIWGDKDTETPLADGRLMDDLIPVSRLEVIPGAGHFPFIENFLAFRQIFVPFMRGGQ